jgi:hypothetical protein
MTQNAINGESRWYLIAVHEWKVVLPQSVQCLTTLRTSRFRYQAYQAETNEIYSTLCGHTRSESHPASCNISSSPLRLHGGSVTALHKIKIPPKWCGLLHEKACGRDLGSERDVGSRSPKGSYVLSYQQTQPKLARLLKLTVYYTTCWTLKLFPISCTCPIAWHLIRTRKPILQTVFRHSKVRFTF